jgi:hypothetical protein
MSEAKKWTASDAGPRQLKAVNTALSKLRWEGKTVVEITGVHGGEEHRSAHIPMMGALSEFAAAAMLGLGERFDWTVTAANANEIVKAAEALIPLVRDNPIVHDLRITPEQDAAERAKAAAAQLERDEASRVRAAEVERVTAELRAIYPWAAAIKAKGLSSQATAAACIRRELADVFPGVTFTVKSSSASMTNSVDIGWTLGPTTAEVEAVTSKYQYGSFDGMTDCYNHDTDVYSRAVGVVLEQSKWVSENRSYPDDLHERIKADLRPLCGETVDIDREHWQLLQRTSFAPGETYAGVQWNDEGNDFVILKTAAATPPPAGWDGTATEGTGSTRARIEQHRHTKKGFDMHIVVLVDRVDRPTFERLRAACEAAGGWYSRQWGKTPGGFAFKERDRAEAFVASIDSTELAAA